MAAVWASLPGTGANVFAESTARVVMSLLGDSVALTCATLTRWLGTRVLSGAGTQLRTALQINRCIDASRF
jgi:hypothetical protein